MCIDDELDALRANIAELEHHGGSLDEWRRIHARAFLAVIAGQMHLTCLRRDLNGQERAHLHDADHATRFGELVDLITEIRALRVAAQGRVAELERIGDLGRVLDV
jgi:hypothetical protein